MTEQVSEDAEDIRFTVYIPSHNYGRFLTDAISSVLHQTVSGWELIVVDDGSDDETPEVMKRYEGDERIRLFRTEGIGLPSVCNFAIQHAQGRYVIRLDGDDIFDENILLVLGNYLDANSEVALVFPDFYLVNDFGEIMAHEMRHKVYEDDHVLDMPPNGACMLIRKSVIDDIGGYREDLGAQDGLDLWTRVRDKYSTANVNLPLFYYRRHGANLTTQTAKILSARRQIKKDAVVEKLQGLHPITAVIPCRKNYDFTQDLWKQEIGGRCLLERDIEVCLGSGYVDKVVVACDNPEAEEVLSRFDDARLSFLLRDPKETIQASSIVKTLRRVYEVVDPEFNGLTLLRYIQTPFVTRDTLEEAITSLVFNDADAAYGVEQIHSQLYRRTNHGLEVLNPKSRFYSDYDAIYRDASTFVATRNKNIARGSLMGAKAVYFEVSAAECFFVNSEDDLNIARIVVDGNA